MAFVLYQNYGIFKNYVNYELKHFFVLEILFWLQFLSLVGITKTSSKDAESDYVSYVGLSHSFPEIVE